MAQPHVTSTACARLLRSSYRKASHLTSTPFPLRASTATSSPSPILDFLAPSIIRHPLRTRPARTSQRHATPTYPQRIRPFTSTPVSRHAILNPRKDDDGNEMNISITPRAANRLAQISNTDCNPNLCLRISVESGGCHGFQYLMSLTDMSKVSRDEDTVFEADYVPSPSSPSSLSLPSSSSSSQMTPLSTIQGLAPGGAASISAGSGRAGGGTPGEESKEQVTYRAKVVLDEPSLELLKGSKVDYTMELIGSQFKVVDNPLATSSCGCGTSFDIKL